MRRAEREIKDFNDIAAVVERCQVVRLAMIDNNKPYIVPVNFGYTADEGRLTLYMHSAKTGRKMDILKNNPYVCFEMDCLINIVKGDIACSWTAENESVIGSGKVEFINDVHEKKAALDILMKRYGFAGTPVYNEKVLEKTCVYKITADEISGKRNIKH